MANKMDRSTLPEETLAKLNEILLQDAESLNEDEVAFLRARRDYLNGSEKERFESVLVVKEVSAEIKLKDMNKDQLLAKCAEMEIEGTEGKTNKELIAMIEGQ